MRYSDGTSGSMRWHVRGLVQSLTALSVVLGLGVCGCSSKRELAAYLRKTDVAAEPVAATSGGAPMQPSSAALASAARTGTTPSRAAAAVPAEPGAAEPRYPSLGLTRSAAEKPIPEATTRSTQHAEANQILSGAVAAPPTVLVVPQTAPTPSAATPATPVGVTTEAPIRNASVGGAAVSGGNVRNAARVIAGLRGGFRECYKNAPADDDGALRFRLTVGIAGTVTNISAQPSGHLASSLVECTTSRVRAAKFDAPEGGTATVVFPVQFSTR